MKIFKSLSKITNDLAKGLIITAPFDVLDLMDINIAEYSLSYVRNRGKVSAMDAHYQNLSFQKLADLIYSYILVINIFADSKVHLTGVAQNLVKVVLKRVTDIPKF